MSVGIACGLCLTRWSSSKACQHEAKDRGEGSATGATEQTGEILGEAVGLGDDESSACVEDCFSGAARFQAVG